MRARARPRHHEHFSSAMPVTGQARKSERDRAIDGFCRHFPYASSVYLHVKLHLICLKLQTHFRVFCHISKCICFLNFIKIIGVKALNGAEMFVPLTKVLKAKTGLTVQLMFFTVCIEDMFVSHVTKANAR